MSSPFKLVAPVREEDATGAVAVVYKNAKLELGTLPPPLMALSAAPELLASAWAALRESLLVGGRQERITKEVVAIAIARESGCSYCTSAHGFLLHAAGAHELAEELMQGEIPGNRDYAGVAVWARSTFTGDVCDPARVEGPFSHDVAPRIIGTALFFHFFTRMVQALTTDSFAPAGQVNAETLKSKVTPTWKRLFDQELQPARRCELESHMHNWAVDLDIPRWSQDEPVGTAWARLKATATQGRELVSHDTAQKLETSIRQFLDDPPTRVDWIDQEIASLEKEHEAARLILLAAIEPSRITPADVEAWQGTTYLDHCLAFLLSYGAIAATSHIENTLVNTAGSGASHA
ncbi:carboxymuconolactone decarboxylase family protein [Natronoglycomyces albus]|uniref:Carboxymuconolactone decarboxylase family protein n=1 Tax=Natronoglycomyces albus TaxID=2811108 RepID=A0A895XR86_9ACTN|nr:carboxymuconolactone decarboxylase family protein [Natronoglycomyces albus]QSB04108.1 carboxymuconolactone decarboxylase family protein [Natronoglycomyces albus]